MLRVAKSIRKDVVTRLTAVSPEVSEKTLKDDEQVRWWPDDLHHDGSLGFRRRCMKDLDTEFGLATSVVVGGKDEDLVGVATGNGEVFVYSRGNGCVVFRLDVDMNQYLEDSSQEFDLTMAVDDGIVVIGEKRNACNSLKVYNVPLPATRVPVVEVLLPNCHGIQDLLVLDMPSEPGEKVVFACGKQKVGVWQLKSDFKNVRSMFQCSRVSLGVEADMTCMAATISSENSLLAMHLILGDTLGNIHLFLVEFGSTRTRRSDDDMHMIKSHFVTPKQQKHGGEVETLKLRENDVLLSTGADGTIIVSQIDKAKNMLHHELTSKIQQKRKVPADIHQKSLCYVDDQNRLVRVPSLGKGAKAEILYYTFSHGPLVGFETSFFHITRSGNILTGNAGWAAGQISCPLAVYDFKKVSSQLSDSKKGGKLEACSLIPRGPGLNLVTASPEALAISQTGDLVATLCDDHILRIYDTEKGGLKTEATFQAFSFGPSPVVVFRGSDQVIFSTENNGYVTYDVEKNEIADKFNPIRKKLRSLCKAGIFNVAALWNDQIEQETSDGVADAIKSTPSSITKNKNTISISVNQVFLRDIHLKYPFDTLVGYDFEMEERFIAYSSFPQRKDIYVHSHGNFEVDHVVSAVSMSENRVMIYCGEINRCLIYSFQSNGLELLRDLELQSSNHLISLTKLSEHYLVSRGDQSLYIFCNVTGQLIHEENKASMRSASSQPLLEFNATKGLIVTNDAGRDVKLFHFTEAPNNETELADSRDFPVPTGRLMANLLLPESFFFIYLPDTKQVLSLADATASICKLPGLQDGNISRSSTVVSSLTLPHVPHIPTALKHFGGKVVLLECGTVHAMVHIINMNTKQITSTSKIHAESEFIDLLVVPEESSSSSLSSSSTGVIVGIGVQRNSPNLALLKGGGKDGVLEISKVDVYHTHPISSIALTKGDKFLVSGDRGGMLNIWTLKALKAPQGTINHSKCGAILAVFETQCEDLVLVLSEDGSLSTFHVPSGSYRGSVYLERFSIHKDGVSLQLLHRQVSIKLFKEGGYLVMTILNQKVVVYSIYTGRALMEISLPSSIFYTCANHISAHVVDGYLVFRNIIQDGKAFVKVLGPIPSDASLCRVPRAVFQNNFSDPKDKLQVDAISALSWGDQFIKRFLGLKRGKLIGKMLKELSFPVSPVRAFGSLLSEAMQLNDHHIVQMVANKLIDSLHNRNLIETGERSDNDRVDWAAVDVNTESNMGETIIELVEKFPDVAVDFINRLPLLVIANDAPWLEDPFSFQNEFHACGANVLSMDSAKRNWGDRDYANHQVHYGLIMSRLMESKREKVSTFHVARVVAIPFPGLLEHSFLDHLVNKTRLPQRFLKNLTVQSIIQYKWEKFGRNAFFREFEEYLVGLIALLVFMDKRRETTLIVAPIIVLVTAKKTYYEIRQILIEVANVTIFGERSNYLSDVWNWFDISQITLTVLALAGRFLFWEHTELFLALLLYLKWFGIFYYLQAFPSLGAQVQMIKSIIWDIRHFVLIMLLSVMAVASAFFALDQDRKTDLDQLLFDMFRMLLLTDYTFSFEDHRYETTFRILFVISMMMVPIVLMNLLIALMGDSYERIQDGADIEYKLLLGKIVVQMEKVTGRMHKPQPRFLQVLLPKQHPNPAVFSPDWQGVFGELKENIQKGNHDMREEMQEMRQDISQLQRDIHEIMQLLQEQQQQQQQQYQLQK